jgi:hypothetical protein
VDHKRDHQPPRAFLEDFVILINWMCVESFSHPCLHSHVSSITRAHAQQAVAQDLWQPFSALAAQWSRAREAPIRKAAAQLYRCLFVGVDSTAHRQEVLQVGWPRASPAGVGGPSNKPVSTPCCCTQPKPPQPPRFPTKQALHGHLGSGQPQEEDVALESLLALARHHTPLLARFGAFLASILDHLECFSDSQLRQVFEMFAALTAPAAGGGGGGEGGGAGACQGGRFEDELHITLSKALSHVRWGARGGVVSGLGISNGRANTVMLGRMLQQAPHSAAPQPKSTLFLTPQPHLQAHRHRRQLGHAGARGGGVCGGGRGARPGGRRWVLCGVSAGGAFRAPVR